MSRDLTKALELIMKFEGFRAKPYKCSAGVPTIGYGTTFYPEGIKVSMKDKPITKEDAVKFLHSHIQKEIVNKLDKLLKDLNYKANDNQYCALVSFCYNLGMGILIRPNSSLSLALVKGDTETICNAILMYNKAGGAVVQGLVNRREAEAKLFKEEV